MNLDDLISKYLDGELLEYEDNELRSELSENPASKEAFDEAVIINSALRDDAGSINPPQDFLLETEEKILMKILSSYPVSADTVYKKAKPKTKYFVTAVAAVILFGFIRLGDGFPERENHTGYGSALESYKNGLDEEMVTYTFVAPDNAQRGINARALSNRHNSFIADNDNRHTERIKNHVANNDELLLADANINNMSDNGKSRNVNDGILATDILSEKSNSAALWDEAENLDISSPITDYHLSQLNNASLSGSRPGPFSASMPRQMTSALSVYDDYSAGSSEIIVTSFLGTDLLKSEGDNVKMAFNHISQSLAYSFTEDDRMGIEFGYTEYSVTDVIGGAVQASQTLAVPNKAIKINKQKVQAAEGFNSSQGSPVFVREPYVYNHNKQMYWGAAFYERTFINTSGLALNLRLGVGSSSDGALGFGKLYANYSIFSGFNVTIGTEGRLFAARLSSNENKEALRKSLSLIYGLQFVF